MNKIMAYILFFLLPFVSAMALDVKVEVRPVSPIVDEAFDVNFIIETDKRDEPMIRFNPGHAEVIGKSNRGEAINAVLLNGKITTERKVTIGYQLISKKIGYLYLRDISVEVGGEVKEVKNIRLNVLQEAKEPQSMFLRAETSKDEYYVGEGIDLKYYIYYRNNIVSQEIKEFPKLNGFIKRFHKEVNNTERVEVDGVLYRRTLVYSARLYAEKIGEIKVDPLRMNIQYSDFTNSTPFGTFGLQLRGYKGRTLSSKTLTLKVEPIPAENAPSNFTGLVGEHKFELTQNKNKYLVNEAVEYRLVVEGEGALEKLDAPTIYSHPDLEHFDTRSEVVEVDQSRARKQFDYTQLPRSPMNFEKGSFELSTFDPVSKSFITHSIDLPGLEVGGSAMSSTGSPGLSNSNSQPERATRPIQVAPQKIVELGFIAPSLTPLGAVSLSFWPRIVMYALVALLVIVLLIALKSGLSMINPQNEYKTILKDIEKNGASYRSLNNLVRRIYPEVSPGSRLSEVINSIEVLSVDERKFINSCIAKAEGNDYGNRDNKSKKNDSSSNKKLVSLMSKVVKSAQL